MVIISQRFSTVVKLERALKVQYKHYSFDLWMTLIKSDLQFKTKRAEYFFNHFNADKRELWEVAFKIKQVDDMCNVVNERAGGSISAIEMYSMVLHRLNYNMDNIGRDELVSVYHNCQQIMQHYPPSLFDVNIIQVLTQLKRSGAKLSILSNTGFINGNTLRDHLKRLEIYHLFDFILFSDEVGMSKPNQQFYNLLAYKSNVDRNQILHVGDNLFADKKGAEKAGMNALLINGNSGKTILNLLA